MIVGIGVDNDGTDDEVNAFVELWWDEVGWVWW